MKITNLSSSNIYIHDLKLFPQSQTDGRRGEDRYIGPGDSFYVPNTSQVLRSAIDGHLNTWLKAGVVQLDDYVNLAANGNPGDSDTLIHGFGYAPIVYVLKKVVVGPVTTWVDATGTYDAVHNILAGSPPTVFNSVTITNTTAGALDFLIRLN